MSFPRFLSGLIEIEDAWLRAPLISSSFRPFGSVSIGSADAPFESAYVNELSNRFGQMKINDAISGSVIDLAIDDGVLRPALRFNDTLTIDAAGSLGVRERVLLPSNIEFFFADPLHFDLDTGDEVGGHVYLKYDSTLTIDDAGKLGVSREALRFDFQSPLHFEANESNVGGVASLLLDGDDFGVENGKLDLKETSYRGFGAVKIGGLSDVDFIDQIISDDDLDLPKVKGIRVQTSDDFTQVTGKLQIKPRGLGQIPYYTLSGLGADEGLYYNSVSNTLSVARVLLNVSYLLSAQDAVSKGFLDQWLLDNPLGGIDIVDVGTSQKQLRVKVDNVTMQLGADGVLNGNYQVIIFAVIG